MINFVSINFLLKTHLGKNCCTFSLNLIGVIVYCNRKCCWQTAELLTSRWSQMITSRRTVKWVNVVVYRVHLAVLYMNVSMWRSGIGVLAWMYLMTYNKLQVRAPCVQCCFQLVSLKRALDIVLIAIVTDDSSFLMSIIYDKYNHMENTI